MPTTFPFSQKEDIMKRAKLQPSEAAAILHDEGLEFISGKFFLNKKEVKNIDQEMLKTGLFQTVNDKDNALDFFKQLYGTSGFWYPLEIIEEAKNHKITEPCYFLEYKQYVILNYLLRHDEEVFFILTGVGGSGKSTFANIICQIFENDTAPLNLAELSDPFMLATGVSKRLIYSDELNADDINGGKLKQLFSNQEITVNPKFAVPYKTRCHSAFFFNCNIAPRLDLCDTGMMRRIIYYAMNKKIEHPDPTLNKKIWSHDDLVNIVAIALQVPMDDWKKLFEEETRYYLVKDNSVYRFRNIDDYDEYAYQCKRSGLKPFSQPKWEDIRALLKDWGFIKECLPF